MNQQEKNKKYEEAISYFFLPFALVGFGVYYYYNGLDTTLSANNRSKAGQIMFLIAQKLGGDWGFYGLLAVLSIFFYIAWHLYCKKCKQRRQNAIG